MSFVERKINFSFTAGQGNTGEAGFSNFSISGLRATAQITYAGSAMGAASLAIYGMPLAMMNQLCYIGIQVDLYKFNTVTVTAGDDENGMYEVFSKGQIIHAWPDIQSAPNACFRIEAKAGLMDSVKPSEPLSYSGPTDVGQIAQTLAGRMGLAFENNGVSLKLNNPVFPFGGARIQLRSLADQARIAAFIDGGTLVISPYGKPRSSDSNSKVLLAPPPQGRMVGYPASTGFGILCKEEFTRPRKFNTTMTVQSDLTPACGDWLIDQVDYSLACFMPHGDWFTFLYGKQIGSSVRLPQ